MLSSIVNHLAFDKVPTAQLPNHPLQRVGANPIEAAVLLSLTQDELTPEIWFGLRSESMPTHKGQVGLPGGKRRIEDKDLATTALRESFEETGLKPQQVNVLGYSNPVMAKGGFIVTPVIGLVPKEVFLVPDGREMTSLFKVPLNFFIEKMPKMDRINGCCYPRWQYRQYSIWGLTAAIVAEFLMTVGLLDSSFLNSEG